MTALPQRFARNALTNYLNALVMLVLALLVTPILVRGLGKEAYGIWVLATTTVLYLDLLKFGFGRATVKYVAESQALGDADRSRRTIATSFFSLALPGVLVIAAGPGLALLFRALFDVPHDLLTASMVIVCLSAVDLGCAIPSDTFGSALMGLQRYDLLNLTLMGTVVAQAVAWTLILALGGGLIAIAVASLGFSLAGQAARYLLARRELGMGALRPRYFDRGLMKPLLSMSGWIAVTEVAAVLTARADAMVVGIIAGVPQAAVYAVGQKLAGLAARFTTPAAALFYPHASSLAAAGDEEGLRRTLVVGTRIGLAVSTPLMLILAVLAAPALRGWVGPGFGAAAPVVAYLSAATVVSTIVRTPIYILRGLGRVKMPAVLGALEGVVNLGLSIGLGLTMGLQGVALATLIATVAVNLFLTLPYACRQVQASTLRLLSAAVGTNLLPAAASVSLGLALRHHGVSGLVQVMGAGALMLTVYVVVLWVTGLSGAERQRIRTALAQRLHGQPAAP